MVKPADPLLSRKKPASDQKRKTFYAYLVCLGLAALFWFLTVFSKEYTTHTSFAAAFVNFPEQKLLVNKLPEKITLRLTSSGFNLALLKYNMGLDTIFIDASELKRLQYNTDNNDEYYLLLNNQLGAMSQMLGSGIRVDRIMPDTVKFRLDNYSSRVIPVKPNLVLEYARQFQSGGPVKITPSRMLVRGPASVINDLKYIETEKTELKALDKTVKKVLRLKNADSLQMITKTDFAIAEIPVVKFTESSVEVPVHIKNVPLGYVVKTFPKSVKVTYRVAMQNYNRIKASQFSLTGDLQDKESVSGQRIKIKLTDYPSQAGSFRLENSSVEFIIRKL